ncbi:class E sortase [Streptomyces chiangmaiensis]|uniref:Class E sortase n=1 Tax=Streptomyces chiangmaiensis TaxID=766497 RepID=A0ABU7FLD1_9ACTN|nr:class E sortase [Streptomyces chiangmaiensis]MED7824761.1 class E sortase [Streptomyces chiangmaiensis]
MRIPVVHHATRRRRAFRRRLVWTGGELLVTVGVVLLLLVVHQLWWTNREAQQGAERKVQALEREWGEPGDSSGSSTVGSARSAEAGSGTTKTPSQRRQTVAVRPARSQAYAVLAVPRLSLRAPVAEGISKTGVLNKGYVGHYPGTAQPGQAGNFAVAGHRNTHGEPFRHLDRLRPGDTVTVETRAATYTYVVDQVLPQTSAGDGGVIAPVPRSGVSPSHGYEHRGYYLTLTTCTPEFTSRYRLVVWGVLASARPR